PSLRVQFVPPPSPLVLAYDMETLAADGKMKDLSGNGKHGTITGTTDVPGDVGRAREFDGMDDKVVAVAPVGGLSQWTIALWADWHDGPIRFEHPIGLGTGHDATFWFSGTIVAFKTQDASGTTVVEIGRASSRGRVMRSELAESFNRRKEEDKLDGVHQC